MRQTRSITYNSDFRRLYYKGKSNAGAFLVLYHSKYRGSENLLGITTSTKLGGAVVRNRVRRLIKESYRLMEHRLKKGYKLVIVARGRCVGATFAQIDRELAYLMRKSDLLSCPSPAVKKEHEGL